MGAIHRYEDLPVWKAAMELATKAYLLSSSLVSGRDFELAREFRKSAISIASNIAEGFERDGNREFAHFLSIAKGSSGELRTQLLLAERLGLVSSEESEQLRSDLLIISKQLSGLSKYLKKSQPQGRKEARRRAGRLIIKD